MIYSNLGWAKEEKCSTIELLGYLLHCESYIAQRGVAKIGMDIFNGTFNEDLGKVSILEGLMIKQKFKISYHNWTQLRWILKDKVELPPMYIMAEKAQLMRPLKVEYNHGVKADLKSCLDLTLTEHIINIGEDHFGEELNITLTWGLDGSGNNLDMNHINSAHFSTSNVMVACFTVTSIRSMGQELWNVSELGHNSPKATRIFSLFPGKEEDALLRRFYPQIEQEFKEIQENGLIIKLDGRKEIKVNLLTCKGSQMDGKMISNLMGILGAYCSMCNTSMKEAHQKEEIKNGFPINRSLEEIMEISEQLMDEEGLIKIKSSDYHHRKGVTKKPISQVYDLSYNLPVLHAKINSSKWLLILIMKLNSSQKWHHSSKAVRYSKEEKKMENDAKNLLAHKLRMELGIKNSDPSAMLTGNLFKTFSSDQGREKLSNMINDEEEREKFKEIHLGLCSIVRIINTQRQKIKLNEFKEFCTEVYLKIVEYWPWAVMSPSIHRILAHAGELMEANEGRGLGGESEEGLESVNKFIKSLRKESARKTSTEANFLDCFNHLWMKSSPLLVNLEQKKLGKQRKRKSQLKEASGQQIDQLVEIFLITE